MRVLMISVRADHGGGPRHIELLIKNLCGSYEIHVACPDDKPYAQRFYELVSGRVFGIPHRKFSLKSALSLSRYIKGNGIDLIHCHGKGAGLYGRFASALTKVALVHTPHGVHVGAYGSAARWFYRQYENLTSYWVKHFIYVSTDERIAASSNGLWPHAASSVIVNGVDDLQEGDVVDRRSKGRRLLKLDDDRLVVATMSRFDTQKNMQEAYKIAKLLPECTFLWMGDGEQKADLERLALRDGLRNVAFLGLHDDPLSILPAADVYLSTSLWEGMPLAVLEAMSVGLPVVATRVTGHSELIASAECGVLYEQGDVEQAAEALRTLASDIQRRKNMGLRGQKMQRSLYSTRRQGKATGDLYDVLVRDRKAS